MVNPQKIAPWAFAIGGLLSANFAFAQSDCAIPVGPNGTIDATEMAAALTACADAPAVWFELVDRGTYDLIYSGDADDPDRRLTGISHADWSQDIPLRIGTLFGFRAAGFADVVAEGETYEIVTYLPDGPAGPRAPDVTQKSFSSGSVEAALFLIGSEQFMIPGEWRIEIRHRDRVLAAQRFDLALPTSE